MLERLFKIKPGEAGRTFLLFTYLFLVITSFVATKATRDALFLERYTAGSLPYADMAAALSVGIVMVAYLRIARHVPLQPLIVCTLLLFAASSVGFWFLGRTAEPSWMVPVLYAWSGVFGVLLPAQTWTLASSVMTTREAKRLFGLVGSGGICGWIVGGLLTKTIALRLGPESLLLMTGGALAVCPVLATVLWRHRVVTAHEPGVGERPGGLRASFELVSGSPHLRATAAVIGISSLVTAVAAWQFRAIAKHEIPDTNQLAAFFGAFSMYAGILSLATQLLVTSRLLGRIGLSGALFVVPVALMVSSFGVLVSGSLLAAVLLKGSDQVFRYSIDRSAVEMLYLPVSPRQMAAAKAFIDTIVWRIGDALGAALVLIGLNFVRLDASQMSALTITLTAGWLIAAWVAGRQYVHSLRASIYSHRIDAERLAAQMGDRSTSQVVASTLTAEDSSFIYTLGEVDPLVELEEFGEISGDPVWAVVGLYLSKPGPAQNIDAVRVLLQAALRDTGPDRERGRVEAARLMRSLPDVFGDELRDLLCDPSAKVACAAIRTVGTLERVDSAPSVIARLADSEAATDAAHTMTMLGDAAVPALRDALDEDTAPAPVKHAIPEILQRIGTPMAEQTLVDRLLEADATLRLRAVTALNTLRQRHPDRRLDQELVETVFAAEILGHYRSYQMLGKLLAEDAANGEALQSVRQAMSREQERIFRLMKLLLPNVDLHSAHFGLQSTNRVVHDNALEFLEHSLPVSMRRLVIPLIDRDVSLEERVRIADRMVGSARETSMQALAAFAESESLLVMAAREAEERLNLEKTT